VPYLLRRREWARAAALLEELLHRDHSKDTLTAVVPYFEQIAAETEGSSHESVGVVGLLQALVWLDPDQAMSRAVAYRAKALAGGDIGATLSLGNQLLHLLLESGDPEAALSLVNESTELARRAGYGRWTQLSHEGQRLQVLNQLGRAEEVLNAADRLLAEMEQLPEPRVPWRSVPPEIVHPWSVREGILMTARWAASELQRWEAALRYGTAVLRSASRRDAHPIELARARLALVAPLHRRGEAEQARVMLRRCREVLEEHQDWEGLDLVRGEVMALESEFGHEEDALALAEDALRHAYLVGDPDDARKHHVNVALSLERLDREAETVLAHYLAAAIITVRMHAIGLERVLPGLTRSAQARSPSFDAVCRRIADELGVQLRDLVARLPQGDDPDAIIARVVGRARDQREGDPPGLRVALGYVEHYLPLIVTAASGNARARSVLEPMLDRWESIERDSVSAFGRALRRLVAGARGEGVREGLDRPWRDIVDRTLEMLAGRSWLEPPPPKRLLTYGEIPDVLKGMTEAVSLVTAAYDPASAQALGSLMARWRSSPDWARTAAALDQILAGDYRSLSLDDIDALDLWAVASALSFLVKADPDRLGLQDTTALELSRAYEDSAPEHAAALWRSVAANGSRDIAADAAGRIAEMLVRQGDTDGAGRWFEKAMAAEGSRAAARAAVHLGWMLARIGDPQGAEAAYRRALSSGHERWTAIAQLNLGGAFLQGRRFDDAEKLLQLAAASGVPEIAARATNNLAVLHAEVGDLEGAQTAYLQAHGSADPGVSADAAIQLAQFALQEDRRDQARGWLQRAIRDGDAEHMAHAAFLLGTLFSQDGDLDEARFQYEQAVDSGVPRWSDMARLGLARLLEQTGDPRAAEQGWTALLDADDEDVRAWAALDLGRSLQRRGEREAAEAAFRTVTSSGARSELVHRAWRDLGRVLAERGNLTGAIAAMRRAGTAPEPRVAGEATGDLWALLVQQGDLDGARELFPAMVDADLTDWSSPGMVALSVLLYQRGDVETAQAVLRQVMGKGGPGSVAVAAFNLGVMYAELGRDRDAETAYRVAIESEDARFAPTAANNLGNLLAQRGDVQGAKPLYRLALRYEDADARPSAAVSLGRILAGEGNVSEAEALYRIAISSGEVDEAPKAANNLGVLLAERGETQRARAAFETSIAFAHPFESARAARHLGVLLAHIDDVAGARVAFERSIAFGHPLESTFALVSLAELLAQAEDWKGAEGLLKRAAAAGQEEIALLARKVMVSLRLKRDDIGGAIEAYRELAASSDRMVAVQIGLMLAGTLADDGHTGEAETVMSIAMEAQQRGDHGP
jgi:tetratricopeptide (TPR) repeat protein